MTTTASTASTASPSSPLSTSNPAALASAAAGSAPFRISSEGHESLAALRAGGKPALARVLALLETEADRPATVALLDAAFQDPRAQVLGITGPPGVGKSTLLGTLIKALRGRGQSVGVIAVDPSSRRSRGALLGDRTRFRTDPADQGVFVRSMAARDRLGGLAELSLSAMVVMRAVFDWVILETVGVGQSETDIASMADTVLFCVQPGSGDSLQFMKAGIAEIPDLVAVTKADLGPVAERARADVLGALGLSGAGSGMEAAGDQGWRVPVLLVSAQGAGPGAGSGSGAGSVGPGGKPGEEQEAGGVPALLMALAAHGAHLDQQNRRSERRAAQAETWLLQTLQERFGREGVKRIQTKEGQNALKLSPGESPFARLPQLATRLFI